jgi:SAM-dependent methyltransferase
MKHMPNKKVGASIEALTHRRDHTKYEWVMDPADCEVLSKWSKKSPFIKRDRLVKIYYELSSREQLDGDVVEMGVFEGHTISAMAEIFKNRKFYGFDTFKGIQGSSPHDSIDYDSAEWSVAKQKVDCPENVKLIQGDVLNGVELPKRIVLAHLDMDIYAPTLAGIRSIWPNLVQGGVIIFDDFGLPHYCGVWKAAYEFCDEMNIPRRCVRFCEFSTQGFLTKFTAT